MRSWIGFWNRRKMLVGKLKKSEKGNFILCVAGLDKPFTSLYVLASKKELILHLSLLYSTP